MEVLSSTYVQRHNGPIVARPLNPGEIDLLVGFEQDRLIVCDLGNEVVKVFDSPVSGWTHSNLENIDYDSLSPYGWCAYLRDSSNWIGTSEV